MLQWATLLCANIVTDLQHCVSIQCPTIPLSIPATAQEGTPSYPGMIPTPATAVTTTNVWAARAFLESVPVELISFMATPWRRASMPGMTRRFVNKCVSPRHADSRARTVRIVKPVLNWANVCSPNIPRTVRRTMTRFLIELLVRRTRFGQFDELYFVLNWLVLRCKLRGVDFRSRGQRTVLAVCVSLKSLISR